MLGRKRATPPPNNSFLETIATRFDGTHSNFLLGSCQVPGVRPIVYCSDGFCELTGYPRSEVLHKSSACEFLYGAETSDEMKLNVFDSLSSQHIYKDNVTFYRKNGTMFHCLLDVVPIENDEEVTVMFLVSLMETNHDPFSSRKNSNECPLLTIEDDSRRSSTSEDFTRRRMHRRRSRAVLYNLSGHLQAHAKQQRRGPKCLSAWIEKIFGRKNRTLLDRSDRSEKPKYMISYRNSWKTTWDCVVFMMTLYVAAIVPYYVALQSLRRGENSKHSFKEDFKNPTQPFDILLEITFIIDIFINFRTTFVDKAGRVEVRPRVIVIHYLKTWFVIDLIAGIPFDIISICFSISLKHSPSLQLIKAVRLLRLFRILHKIDKWSQYTPVVLISLIVLFGMLAHWLACFWFTIGWNEYNDQPHNSDKGVGWIYELSDVLNKPFHVNKTGGPDSETSYVTALYFTMSSLTSVGFGNVSANTNTEKIFSICVMMIGALMHALVFGNVTAMIQRMYARRSHFDSKMKDIKDFIKVHRIPKAIKRRMIEYFQTSWKRSKGVSEYELLREFPQSIRVDVAMSLHKELLTLPIFGSASPGCRRFISLHLSRVFAAPTETVVYEGDPLDYVYLVCSGSLEVTKNDIVTAILGKGDLFGANMDNESVLTSRAVVKALTHCEIQRVERQCLLRVIDMYPEYAESLVQWIRCDFTCDLWMEQEEDGKISDEGMTVFYPSVTVTGCDSSDEVFLTSCEEELLVGSQKDPLVRTKTVETIPIKTENPLAFPASPIVKSASKSCLRPANSNRRDSVTSTIVDKKVTFTEVQTGERKNVLSTHNLINNQHTKTKRATICSYSDTDSISSTESCKRNSFHRRRLSEEVSYTNRRPIIAKRSNSCRSRNRPKNGFIKKSKTIKKPSVSIKVDEANDGCENREDKCKCCQQYNSMHLLLQQFSDQLLATQDKLNEVLSEVKQSPNHHWKDKRNRMRLPVHDADFTSTETQTFIEDEEEEEFGDSFNHSRSSPFTEIFSTSAPPSLCPSPNGREGLLIKPIIKPNKPEFRVQISHPPITNANHLNVPTLTNGCESGYHSTSPTMDFS